jgi:antitoxin component of RelBE/YafQ-DinJ toxin-antitoxin module
MSGPQAITEAFKKATLDPITARLDSGATLSRAAENEAKAAAETQGLNMDAAITEYFVAQRIKDSRLPLDSLGEVQKRTLSDSAYVVSQTDSLIDLVQDPAMKMLLNRFTQANITVAEGLKGEIPAELRPIANRLRFLTENYGRSRSGAVIGEDELVSFQAQTGRLGLTQDELLGRLMSLRDDAEGRVVSIIDPIRRNQTGFSELYSPEEQQLLISQAVDAQLPGFRVRELARQIVDAELGETPTTLVPGETQDVPITPPGAAQSFEQFQAQSKQTLGTLSDKEKAQVDAAVTDIMRSGGNAEAQIADIQGSIGTLSVPDKASADRMVQAIRQQLQLR